MPKNLVNRVVSRGKGMICRYPQSRLRWKIELVKGLYVRGWNQTDIWALFRFLDWLMALPDKYELQFEKAVTELGEEQKMRYVTHIERRAKAEGIKEGALQSVREIITEVLTLRFGVAPQELIALLYQVVDLEQLKKLHRQAVLAGSLEEFEHVAETTIADNAKVN
jgi:hypothetical protein